MDRMVCLSILLLLGTAVAHALTLAQAEQSRAVIVVGEEPAPAEKTVAVELASYLKRITGAEFRVGTTRGLPHHNHGSDSVPSPPAALS